MAEPLHVSRSGSGPPLLLIHGFLGSSVSWAPVLPSLEERNSCLAVDLPGHGNSLFDDAGKHDLPGLILATLNDAGIDRCAVMGYSMGARLALHFAHRHPHRVEKLVLESGTPGIEDEPERIARARADERLADKIEQEGIAAFVSYWENLPIFASHATVADDDRQRQRTVRESTNPAAAAYVLREFSPGVLPSLWSALPNIDIPMLAVAGERDAKYCAIAHRVAELAPTASAVIVEGAGHTPHLENPEGFLNALGGFL